MKSKKKKKEAKKFDLEKMSFAKLKSLHLIVGGGGGDDPNTGTATSKNCNGGVDH
ncbi:hypothetical protein [Flavobacterium foetidum]|uniref:hypothetical protein n=1 Tax=Flavobacterium foetidum TaxID=2026681 RepID=UPI0013C2C8F9|nr:hypothetical protein [Flavobacterium foetidum]KAF2516659.1 hypothetical protein E0W73_06100 [Flavobacterium foetidum]